MIRKILLGIDIFFLVICIAIGIDYSYYTVNIKYVNDTKTVILADIINLNCEDKNISINDKLPGDIIEKEFEVANLTDKDTTFNILLTDINNSYDNNLVYELYNDDKVVISQTVAPASSINNYIKINIPLKSAETKKYVLRFGILNRNNNEEEYFKDKNFSANLQINSLQINSEIRTATNYLLDNNPINNETETIDGFFKLNENNVSIYYYKGNVTNNYVSFNNELWRIIRINEDGSIRIVKNDNLGENIRFNDDSKSDVANNYQSSNVKNKLNAYYNEILKNYESMLIQEAYCTNLNIVKNDNYKTSDTDKNINEFNVLLSCNDTNKNMIGLLSYNDVILAGLSYNSNSLNYLLDGDNINTWLSTKAGENNYTHDKYVWYLDKNSIKDAAVNNENMLRPVINLKASLNVSGNGTIETPYIFSE